jgi:murein DD-endopeptidase MepM/ murein hydrolase activator NlpD
MKTPHSVPNDSILRQALSRRTLFWSALAGGLATRGAYQASAQAVEGPAFSYPMGLPGQPLGDGLIMRHGYACENTWFFPGWWHTGENWYPRRWRGMSAGIPVYAVADGEVVYADFDYPGASSSSSMGPISSPSMATWITNWPWLG